MRGQGNHLEVKDHTQSASGTAETQANNQLSPADGIDNEGIFDSFVTGSQPEKAGKKRSQSRTTSDSRTDLSDYNDYDTGDDGTVVANIIPDDSANENAKSGTVLKVYTKTNTVTLFVCRRYLGSLLIL